MKKLRNILAVALILCLMVGLMPMAAFADDANIEENTGNAGGQVEEVVESTSVETGSTTGDAGSGSADGSGNTSSESSGDIGAVNNNAIDNNSAESGRVADNAEVKSAADNNAADIKAVDNNAIDNNSAESGKVADNAEVKSAADNNAADIKAVDNNATENNSAENSKVADSAEATSAEGNNAEDNKTENNNVTANDSAENGKVVNNAAVKSVADNNAADFNTVDNNAADNAAPQKGASDSGAPQAPEAFNGNAPVAPVAPTEPDLTGLSDEAANEKIRIYNQEVASYNEAVEQYNTEFDAYEAAASEYNASVKNFNDSAASYNAKADEHNQAEQKKLDDYTAAMENYNQKAGAYNDYQKKIDTVSERNMAKAEDQMKSLGDISRLDKESILLLGTVLEDDYTTWYGSVLGRKGDLVVSWDALKPGTKHSTIQVQEGAKSDETYKVANLHIFEDFADFNEMNDYQEKLGWDCMNINVDDENGVIIIPKAVIDRIALLEIEVAEVDKNDTVTVLGQNNIFTSNYVTTVGRFFEGYSDGPYWYSAGNVFQSTAKISDSDWTGTAHTFSYSEGTTDRAGIKNPLYVNHYVFQRYPNPNVVPEKPEEVSVNMMDKAKNLSFIEVLGSKLSRLLGLTEREIKTEEKPAPVAPVDPVVPVIPKTPVEPAIPEAPIVPGVPEIPPVPAKDEIPDEATPLAEPEQTADEPDVIPAPVAPVIPAEVDIPDEATPLAEPEQAAEKPAVFPTLVNVAAEKVDGQSSTLVYYESAEEIADDETPLASGASWALVNLIACLLTVLLAMVSLVNRREKEDGSNERETCIRLGLVIPAVASVTLFILTEDMRNPMAMVDVWTPVMLVILVANCLMVLAASRKNGKEKSRI